jgi:hypothetical protein
MSEEGRETFLRLLTDEEVDAWSLAVWAEKERRLQRRRAESRDWQDSVHMATNRRRSDKK